MWHSVAHARCQGGHDHSQTVRSARRARSRQACGRRRAREAAPNAAAKLPVKHASRPCVRALHDRQRPSALSRYGRASPGRRFVHRLAPLPIGRGQNRPRLAAGFRPASQLFWSSLLAPRSRPVADAARSRRAAQQHALRPLSGEAFRRAARKDPMRRIPI